MKIVNYRVNELVRLLKLLDFFTFTDNSNSLKRLSSQKIIATPMMWITNYACNYHQQI